MRTAGWPRQMLMAGKSDAEARGEFQVTEPTDEVGPIEGRRHLPRAASSDRLDSRSAPSGLDQ
jgi:hypothetical protein